MIFLFVLVISAQRANCIVSVKKYQFAQVPVTGFEVISEGVTGSDEVSCILQCSGLANAGSACMGALFDEATGKCQLGNVIEPQVTDSTAVRVALAPGKHPCRPAYT